MAHRSALLTIGWCVILVAAFVPLRVHAQAADSVARDSTRRLGAVQVTATLTPTPVSDVPQPVTVLSGAALRRAQGAALGDALEQIPGLRSLSMSTGIGKPVIRGLTHNRIVTLDNGQRTETQQWGHDHSPNVETANAEQIEVIKGPGSVLFGSDALGGVINVIAPPLPEARATAPYVRVRTTTSYNSNVRGPDGTIRLDAANGGFGARIAATGRTAGDMRTPQGALRNTGNTTSHLDATVGYTGSAHRVSLRASERGERIEIFDDPITAPGYTGYQRLTTTRGTLDAKTALGTRDRLQAQLGVERNFRREFDAADAQEIALGLLVNTTSGYVHLHHRPIGPFTSGTLGVFALNSRFEKRGTETLIPSSQSRNIAVYALEHIDRGRWRASVGARWDRRDLTIEDDTELALTAQSQRHDALTGSMGLAYRIAPWSTLTFNVGRGFRAPAAPDLFANGFHEGTRAFERGNPNLRIETSLNTDVGLRIEHERITGELSVYRNRIDDYIYLRPFGGSNSVLDSLEVVQGNALLRGAEGRFAIRTLSWLTLEAVGDVVRGDNTAVSVPLTFVPPPRLTVGARAERASVSRAVRSPWVSVQMERNWRQTRLDPRDVAPPGYTLWQLGAGGSLLTRSRVVLVDVAVRNLMDTRFRSFMSRYKEFADGPGRTLIVRFTTEW